MDSGSTTPSHWPVPTVLPGLNDVLFREALERRRRQELREQEALEALRSGAIPWISKASQHYVLQRLERQLLEAFERVSGRLEVPKTRLNELLQAMQLEAEPNF